ncbi:MAG: DNA mismatch repair endonuclease MutL [Candidatus Omnitrophica bacterium]|nr:DNA mismatch repair endonuclease MutL [Candidatus Omnitrophota bacterium]
MGVIKVLPENIANRIAAGEVIERPGSIAKELIENSLDAGARTIEIDIRHGGKSLIRVSDDGCGMSAEDAELAFSRHATSKISDVEDLNKIATYGFRGEALPSIAAVSRTKVLTRPENPSNGIEMSIEGGKLKSAKEAPCAKGTTVEVRDLFFNTPARRKFLKADTTEMGHILDVVTNMAFSRLDVRFILKSLDKVLLDLPQASSVRERAVLVYGDNIAKQLIDIEGETQNLKVKGVVGKPAIARSNRASQSFFINKRWIKAFPFSYALQAAYHGLLMQGQYPFAILHLEMDLERVDVNVHPTKQEVRISSEAAIKSFLKELVAGAISKERDRAPRWGVIDTKGQSGAIQRESIISSDSLGIKQEDLVTVAEPVVSYTSREAAEGQKPIRFSDRLKITKILGQIHQTFIVAETEEGMVLVDQHAAHERVMFEVLMKNFESGKPAKQGLLMDEILEVKPKHREFFDQSRPTLEAIGFEIETFGEGSFVIRSVPAILGDVQPSGLLEAFLEEKEEGKVRTSLENQKEEVAALIACKRKSVKAHEAMSLAAMESLLKQLGQCDNPFNCPHGRPTLIKYSFGEMEKQFKRK